MLQPYPLTRSRSCPSFSDHLTSTVSNDSSIQRVLSESSIFDDSVSTYCQFSRTYQDVLTQLESIQERHNFELNSSYLDSLSDAVSQANQLRKEFNVAEEEAFLILEAFVFHNEQYGNPNEELSRMMCDIQGIMEKGDQDLFSCDAQLCTTVSRGREASSDTPLYIRGDDHISIDLEDIRRFRGDMPHLTPQSDHQNRFMAVSSWLLRHGSNLSHVGFRHIFTVLLTTYVRQCALHFLGELLDGASGYVPSGVAFACLAIPLMLNVWGLCRDQRENTQSLASIASRVLNIVVAGGLLIGAYMVSAPTEDDIESSISQTVLSRSATNLSGFTLYCALRDTAQVILPLSDNTLPVTLQGTLVSAGIYFFNQTVVSYLMGLASPSGASSSSVPYASVVLNDFLRALINYVGETVDTFTFASRHADEPLQIQFPAPRIPSGVNILDTLTRNFAGRTTLFSAAVVVPAILNQLRPPSGRNVEHLIAAATDGGVLMLLYPLFIGAAAGQNPRVQPEEQNPTIQPEEQNTTIQSESQDNDSESEYETRM